VCVPAIANIFPRRWYPPEPGENRKPGSPTYTGEFLDGFGNKVTVHAVFNPHAVKQAPEPLTHRAPGYGIIEFDRTARKITVTNWPRWVDATRPGAEPCDGWPITIGQTANGFPQSGWLLEEVRTDEKDAVIQVVDQSSDDILYTYRIQGQTFRPAVPKDGMYTVKVLSADGKPTVVRKDQKARKS
ncbi:MAG: hypothetical protein ACRD7E_02190, partial [Bryobacteraceae bacterium]